MGGGLADYRSTPRSRCRPPDFDSTESLPGRARVQSIGIEESMFKLRDASRLWGLWALAPNLVLREFVASPHTGLVTYTDANAN